MERFKKNDEIVANDGACDNDTTVEGIEVDLVDLEEYAGASRKPPPARRYRVKIDHDHYVIEKRFIIARELLELAGKTPPESYELEKRMSGGNYVPLELDQEVDLGEPGIEVFESFPLDETEG